MEQIKKALERARALDVKGVERIDGETSSSLQLSLEPSAGQERLADRQGPRFDLNVRRLESQRIIAYDDLDPRSKSFDILRTQVLRSMDRTKSKILGITSPTSGCGKTVTALNLAFSIARHPERSVLLVDLDLQKPQVASRLGLNCGAGVISVLEGRTNLSSSIVMTRAGKCSLPVLPAEGSTSGSSAWMASRAMNAMIQEIKRDRPPYAVILDLPPMLSSDDVIALLPQLDCVLLVTAVGKSKISEIEECCGHLQSAVLVHHVLNKVPGQGVQYYAPTPRVGR
jgi:Mrp family chromosome partitioning ATPase